MWGVSLGDYVIYWLGMAVITVVAVAAGIVAWIRTRGRR